MFDVTVSGVPENSVYAVTLSRASEDTSDPIVERLSGPGETTASGTISLSVANAAALAGEQIYVRVFTALGEIRGNLTVDR